MKKKDEIVWSFSRLDWSCLHEWHKHYTLKEKGQDNSWSQMGGFMHDLCERVAKEEITEEEALVLYCDNYDEAIPEEFPRFQIDLKIHYYNKCMPFFQRKKWWNGSVISVEEEMLYTLPSGEKMRGFIDLALDANGDVILVDHKVSKKFTKKQLATKQRQLLLYAYAWKQKHGVMPSKLIFNFFQVPAEPHIVIPTEENIKEAIDWAEGRIETIQKLQKLSNKLDLIGVFMPDFKNIEKKDGTRDFYCQHLCSYRNSCKFTKGNDFINKEILKDI